MFRHRAALQLVERGPVLDVGTGDGLLLAMLASVGISGARGVDLSPVAVRVAREKGLDVQRFDATARLPFADGEFATACALDVLEHLTDPVRLVEELSRVAGSVVLAVPNFLHWRQRLQVARGIVPFQCRPARGHVYWFTEEILLDVAGRAGLRPERLLREPGTRLGGVGRRLADLRPSVFAVSVAARFTAFPR
jgi:SAM-dependent methyltransferase